MERLTRAPGAQQLVLPPDGAGADMYARDEGARCWRARAGPSPQTELLLAIARVTHRSAAKEETLGRLKETGNLALISSFLFVYGMLCKLEGETAEESSNAARKSALAFQAAIEVFFHFLAVFAVLSC